MDGSIFTFDFIQKYTYLFKSFGCLFQFKNVSMLTNVNVLNKL